MTSTDIAQYWDWDIERLKYIGLLCQVLGLFLYLALWWLQDRAWRVCRWLVLGYFVVVGFVRYGQWIVFSLISPDMTEQLRAFVLRSGIVGFVVCAAFVVFIILDQRNRWVSFSHFSPEAWSSDKPGVLQWLGLVISLLALWSPFLPNLIQPFLSIYVWGFPTSFGVTVTPVLLYIGGLFLAGSKDGMGAALIWCGIGTVVLTLFSDPVSLHGVIIAVMGFVLVLVGRLRYVHQLK